MINTLQDIIENDLCCNCGTCEGICPKNAIQIRLNDDKRAYKPVIDDKKCVDCNICYSACPGYFVDFKSLNKYLFGKEPDDLRMGVYSNCYIGHSINKDIRYNSSSGGLITTLLIYCLDKGIINGALVTKMQKDNPLEPEPFIARNKEEIIEAAKSKYCPVPANKMLKELLNSQEEKIAVVGLPCHIQGIRKAEMINETLKRKIVLHLGIFCSHTDTLWQTEFLLNQMGIDDGEVNRINYRGNGWPGNMSIELKNGDKNSLPYKQAMSQHTLWINSLFRCLFCCDLTAELADMSFGDPWIPEITKTEKRGKSIVICRTGSAEQLLLNAFSEDYINLDKISSEKVKESGSMMESKKKDINCRFFIRRIFRGKTPVYNALLLKPGIKNYLRALFIYFNVVVSSKSYLKGFAFRLTCIESWVMKKLMGDN